jgi:hypothetical protein
MQDDIYYEKYLKYKAKYLALKEQEGGLLTLKSGTYVFFCNSKYVDQICPSIHGKSPSNAKLNEILSKADISYRAKNGDTKLELVAQSQLHKQLAMSKVALKNTSESLKQTASNVGTAVAARAREVGSAVVTGARAVGSTVGSAVATGARNVGSAIATGARAVGSAAVDVGSHLKQQTVATYKNVKQGAKQRFGSNKVVVDLDQLQDGGAAAPDVVKVSTPVNTASEPELKGLILKLQKIDPSIDSAIVIEIKTVGSNKCLSIIKVNEGPAGAGADSD